MSETNRAVRRQWAHPLSGSNAATLRTVLHRHGGVSRAHLGQLAIIAGSVAARSPFTWAERLWGRRRLRRAPAMPPPVFILGHWRSGTTHLYNILSRSPRLGFVPPLATGMPWDMLLLGRWLRPVLEQMLPAERFIDRIPVKPDSPQEDEAAMANLQPVSFYHALYFPRKLRETAAHGVFFDGCSPREVERWRRRFVYFLQKLSLQQGGRRLVIKNPVYTARVAMLRDLFPDARFIHIHRNPYVVFQSMRNFYTKLLEAYALQSFDEVEAQIDELILETYPRMMDRLQRDTADLPPDRFIELGYTQLDSEPLDVVEKIFTQLRLEGFEEARPHFQEYIASVAGYRKNRYRMSPEVAERVERRWGANIERWGYRRPAAD